MPPLSIRCAPNHSTATLDTFTTSMTVGNISAISRPTASDTSVSSVLALAEAVLLVLVADEGADHPDAGDLLAQHPVHRVDAHLHRAEQRPHPAR